MKKDQFFGTFSFITAAERVHSTKSVGFSTLIKLPRKEFIELLKLSSEDYEKFCMLKD